MSRYRVIVEWTESDSYEVEADDEDEAKDQALSLAYDEHPFADDYDIVFEPELMPETAA